MVLGGFTALSGSGACTSVVFQPWFYGDLLLRIRIVGGSGPGIIPKVERGAGGIDA